MSNRPSALGQRQGPAIYGWALAEPDQARPETRSTDPDMLVTDDSRPKSCHLDIGAENRQQVTLRGPALVGLLPDKTVGRQPNPSGRILQPLLELRESETLMCIFHSISAVSPLANATTSSWTNCSRSRMMIFSSSVSSVLMTLFLVFQAAT